MPRPLPKAGLPVPQGLPHVVHDDPDCSRARLGDRLALGPQDGITQEADAVYGHPVPCLGFRVIN